MPEREEASEPEEGEDLIPRAGCWFFVLPILAATAVVLAYAILWGMGIYGRPANGPRERMAFTGCDQARAVVKARVEAMGLGNPVFEDTSDGFAVTATLPADPKAAKDIPSTLAAIGAFTIRGGKDADGEILADRKAVTSASLRLNFTVAPSISVELTPVAVQRIITYGQAHPGGSITFWLDGRSIGTHVLDPKALVERVDIEPGPGRRDVNIRRSAAWALEIQHGPLPCPLTVQTGS